MDTAFIQKRIDALSNAMTAKGLRQAHACCDVRSNAEPQVYICWKPASLRGIDRYSSDEYQFYTGPIAEMIDKADAFVATLPDAEKAKLTEFMSALGSLIDIGRESNIDVDFVNPLIKTMEKLSKNVLTDQRAA